MPSVGDRIESDGDPATILFIGQVAGTKGEWLGVEWDDPSRGKHDGTHEDVRYFNTRHPTAGSFIRVKKATFGVALLQALYDRYGLVADTGGIELEEMFVVDERNKVTTVEVVGAQSVNQLQSKFESLLEVCLRGCGVSSAGIHGDIREKLPAVEELDLSRNLLPSWTSVASITQQLPRLHILNLSENQLSYPAGDTVEATSESFSTVRTASLNKSQLTWQQVLDSTTIMRHLEQLHVCFNQITSICGPGNHLEQLQLLNLEGNTITDWSQLLQIGSLPSLQTLILNQTGLTEIRFPDVGRTKYFPKLHTLSVASNNIQHWSSINELAKLASLQALTFRKNPILDTYPDLLTSWAVVVAKLGHLKFANRTEIIPMERKGAELDYLRIFGAEWKKSGGNVDPSKNQPNETFINNHPRYQELINKFGALDDSLLKEQSTALKGRLITVMLDCPNLIDKKPIRKKLPLSMTVQKMKTLTQRLFKVNPACMMAMKLSYTSQQMPDTEFEMDYDQKEIDYYSVDEGDTIHVRW